MARSLLLLLLIAVVAAGGLVWFDYLNVIDLKTDLAPVYRLLGKDGRSQGAADPEAALDLDAEREAVLLETLSLRESEIQRQENDLLVRHEEVERIASELEERTRAVDDREKSMSAALDMASARDKNIEQLARYYNGMPPQNAVANLLAQDDQMAIDILRKVEALAQAEGTASIVSFWFSLMPPQRAADLQRKMAERPN
jgi:flagellar protein FlbB